MKTRRGTVLMIVVGVALSVVIVFAGAAAWFFFSAFEATVSDDVTAARAFDDIRSRFGQPPLIEIRGREAARTRTPSAGPPADLQRVRILSWNPEDMRLAQITLPWWLLRLKEGPIDITSDAGSAVSRTRLSITVEELERYGPTLLLDHSEPDGSQVIVWTE